MNINSSNVRTDLLTGIDGKIIIGNDVSINFGVSIVAENKVTLGNRIRIGPYTMIIDTDRHIQNDRFKWAKGEPVIIEDDVWLATRVMVLKGSLIGKGSMIASGSVVSGVIPPYVVAGGIPARVL
ncbi:MAG: acyltransferase, partial [Balneolales bacterium]